MAKFGPLDHRGAAYAEDLRVGYGRYVMSIELLEVSLLGPGTVLRLERDAWSIVKRLRRATNEYAPSLLPVSYTHLTLPTKA